MTLKIGDANIFPIGKAYKRIKNGSLDDVWFYYQVLAERIINTDPSL